jgi:hypothetical protein
LCGQRFFNDDKVKGAMHMWLQSQQKTFFADGIRRLVDHYTTCFGKRAHYVEKLYTLYLPQIVVHEVINKFTLLFDRALHLFLKFPPGWLSIILDSGGNLTAAGFLVFMWCWNFQAF